MRKRLMLLGLTAASALVMASPPTRAATASDAKGLWLTADKDAVIEFKDCSDTPGSLCATIVWDKDAGTPADTCGLLIAKLKRYEDEAWRDGWVYDPRSKKHYKAAVRVKQDTLSLRAFIGAEILGDTEEMSRVASLPAGCNKH